MAFQASASARVNYIDVSFKSLTKGEINRKMVTGFDMDNQFIAKEQVKALNQLAQTINRLSTAVEALTKALEARDNNAS